MENFLYPYPKQNILLSVVLFYPNNYYVGMSSLAFQSVYHQLQSHPHIRCERAFYNEKEKNVRTLETGRDLLAFDVIFVSLSFEEDLIHLVKALENSQIDATHYREKNYIIVGGIATTFLAGYLSAFCDIVASGEAELLLPPLLEILLTKDNKNRVLAQAEKIPGLYPHYVLQPESQQLEYYQKEGLNEIAHTVILTEETEFSQRGLIEIAKGCAFRCAFCVVHCAYGKHRSFSPDSIYVVAEKYSPYTDKIGLVAASLTSHPDFKQIIIDLNKKGFQLSFSSFRIEGLDDELLELIIANENKTLTIAPETVSPKLQQIIRKKIPPEMILDNVRTAVELGIKRLKLYFLIGLPGETGEDLEAIIRLVKEIFQISKTQAGKWGYVPEIIVDVNPLVPKPGTELENCSMEEVGSLKKKILYLKKHLHGLGRVFVQGESPRRAKLQYQIAHYSLSLDEISRLKT